MTSKYVHCSGVHTLDDWQDNCSANAVDVPVLTSYLRPVTNVIAHAGHKTEHATHVLALTSGRWCGWRRGGGELTSGTCVQQCTLFWWARQFSSYKTVRLQVFATQTRAKQPKLIATCVYC